jgi:outer membrane protein OmpA-like peptidoglycan-associated protein
MKNIFLSIFVALTSLTLAAQTSTGKHHIKYLEVNTTQSDYGVAFLDDNNVVFTTPADENSNNSQSDLFVGEIDEQGEIVNKEPIHGMKAFKKVSKTGVTYSNDQKTVYFSAKKHKKRKNKNKAQLFRATIDSLGNWINIEKLSFNKKKFSAGEPSLSKDGKKLYFASDRPSSYGGTDIFVVNINEDGTYSEPVNLGDKINTSGDEVTPYITDNNILFYSSNGREDGYGNLDVYATEIFSNIASEPLHLESPVNSINDDFAYIVNSNSKGGFFSSNRLQGQDNNDIYSFIIEDIKPEKCLQQIAGVVKDKETMEIIKDAAMTLFDNDGNQVQQVLTDKNGEYSFDLDCSQTYTLVASSLYYSKEEHIINTANYNRAPELEANKFLSKMTGAELEEALATAINGEQPIKEETKAEEPIEKVIEEASINDVYFGFDKSNITSESAKELDKLASIMEKNASLNIEVSAYTDARGSSAYNLKLSNRRAKSTIEYLVSKGIERSRISGKGYGESNMVNKCVNGVECSEDAHQKNRRTEITFVNGTAQTFNVNNSKQIIASQNNDVELTNDVNILSTQQIVKKKS